MNSSISSSSSDPSSGPERSADGRPRYLAWFASITALSLIATAVFVQMVDPFGLGSAFALDSLRPFASERGSRTFKSDRVAHGGDEVLLLGSSRTQWGLDPAHPAFGARSVFNAALAGTSLYETVRMVRLGRENPNLSKMLLVVHLGLFHAGGSTGGDFDQSLLNENLGKIDYAMEKIWSIRALEAAVETVENSRSDERSSHTESGLRAGGQQHPDRSPRELFEAVIAGYLLRDYRFGDYHYGQAQLRRFREIVSIARDDGVELVVAIAPVHVSLLEVIREAGLWPLFEAWKRDLVESLRGTGFALYDFTGYTAYTSEAVPLDSKPGDAMRWWIECSHFNRELGNRILDRIVGEQAASPNSVEFGALLTPDNLDTELARIKRERDAWIASEPDQIRWLDSVMRRARAGEIETL